MPIFDLVDVGGDKYWWERRADEWHNECGGHFSVNPETQVFETVEAADWNDLDYTQTSLVDSARRSGWLSPDGIFHGCRYHEHDQYAYRILNSTVDILEHQGWARIYDDETVAVRFRLTADQRNYLSLNGYRIGDWQ